MPITAINSATNKPNAIIPTNANGAIVAKPAIICIAATNNVIDVIPANNNLGSIIFSASIKPLPNAANNSTPATINSGTLSVKARNVFIIKSITAVIIIGI